MFSNINHRSIKLLFDLLASISCSLKDMYTHFFRKSSSCFLVSSAIKSPHFNITSFDNEINALECLRHHSKLLKWYSFQQQNFASRIAKMFRGINYAIFQIVALLDNKLPDQTDLVLHEMPYHTESNLYQMSWVCPGGGSALLDLIETSWTEALRKALLFCC